MGWAATRVYVLAWIAIGGGCDQDGTHQPETSASSAPSEPQATEVASVPAPTLPNAAPVATYAPPVETVARVVPPWCGTVTIRMLNEAQEGKLIAEFRRRNRTTGAVDPLTSGHHFLTNALAYRPEGDALVEDEAGAIAAARKLAETNADLLGFTAAEIRGAEATVSGRAPQWNVLLARKIPRPGYEAFPTVARDIRIRVMFMNGMMLVNRAPLPAFKLCKEPTLPPTSPKLAEAIVGQPIGFGTNRRATAADIASAEPTIFVQHDRELHSVTLTLAYELKLGSHTAFVDANSGVLLAMRPNFYESD